MPDLDYDHLLERLKAPAPTVFHPVREWVIAHDPPEGCTPAELFPHSLLQAVPPENRHRLIELVGTMLVDAGLPQGLVPDLPVDVVNLGVLAEFVEAAAVRFDRRMRRDFPHGTATPPGRLYPPPPWPLHRLDEAERFYGWEDYFLDSWLRAAMYTVPVRLPGCSRPEFEALIRSLPPYCRDRWRHAITEHFRAEGVRRMPTLMEVAAIPLEHWRAVAGMTWDETDSLTRGLHRMGHRVYESEEGRAAARDD